MTHAPGTLPELPTGQDGFDGLALNYRTAHSIHAQAMFEELEEFVRAYGLACFRAGAGCDGYAPIASAPTDREILVWNGMYGWYRTKSYEIDGHRVWPLYGLFGTDGGVWYPGPTYWMEVPPSPTGRQTCNHFESAEFNDKRERAERYAPKQPHGTAT